MPLFAQLAQTTPVDDGFIKSKHVLRPMYLRKKLKTGLLRIRGCLSVNLLHQALLLTLSQHSVNVGCIRNSSNLEMLHVWAFRVWLGRLSSGFSDYLPYLVAWGRGKIV